MGFEVGGFSWVVEGWVGSGSTKKGMGPFISDTGLLCLVFGPSVRSEEGSEWKV